MTREKTNPLQMYTPDMDGDMMKTESGGDWYSVDEVDQCLKACIELADGDPETLKRYIKDLLGEQ